MTYSYKHFFRQFYESAPPKYACTASDAPSFLIWKAKSRDRLRELLGLSRLEQFVADSAPYSREAELISAFQEDGYTRYKLSIQTLPEVFMPFYMLVPDGLSNSRPHKLSLIHI